MPSTAASPSAYPWKGPPLKGATFGVVNVTTTTNVFARNTMIRFEFGSYIAWLTASLRGRAFQWRINLCVVMSRAHIGRLVHERALITATRCCGRKCRCGTVTRRVSGCPFFAVQPSTSCQCHVRRTTSTSECDRPCRASDGVKAVLQYPCPVDAVGSPALQLTHDRSRERDSS
jgi:hypothetical protein